MIGWLEKRIAERKTAKRVQRFKQHFSKAACTQLERILIAAAMVEIEDPMIQEERDAIDRIKSKYPRCGKGFGEGSNVRIFSKECSNFVQ